MHKPDYTRSIVNLMASLRLAFGGGPSIEPPLAVLPPKHCAERTVLIIVDGLGYERVNALAGSTLQRHLQGALHSVFPTTTVSAITSIYTGVAPHRHGMTGWFTWFRELGSVAAVLPFMPRIGGVSYTALGIDPAQLFAQPSFFAQLAAPGRVLNPAHIAQSAYSRACGGPAYRHAYHGLDELFSQLELALQGPPGLTLAYWPDYDALCHHHGVHSTEATALLHDFDARLARFLDALATRDITMIITADHGMVDTDAEHVIRMENHPELRANLSLPLCGEPRAAFCYVHAHRRERFVDYVHERLGHCCELLPSEQMVAEGWFGTAGDPHPELRHRVGDYTLLLKENYVITERLPGERPFAQVAVHGGASATEINVPLIVVHP